MKATLRPSEAKDMISCKYCNTQPDIVIRPSWARTLAGGLTIEWLLLCDHAFQREGLDRFPDEQTAVTRFRDKYDLSGPISIIRKGLDGELTKVTIP